MRKKFRTDLHEIFREGWQWANEQMVKFWWRSGRIATLVKRTLAEACAVPMLVVCLFVCLSVCLSVTLVRRTQPVEILRNVSSPFGTLADR